MREGELVNFVSPFWEPHVERRNPGIVIEVFQTRDRKSCVVLWADGKTSTEHTGFLERAVNEDR